MLSAGWPQLESSVPSSPLYSSKTPENFSGGSLWRIWVLPTLKILCCCCHLKRSVALNLLQAMNRLQDDCAMSCINCFDTENIICRYRLAFRSLCAVTVYGLCLLLQESSLPFRKCCVLRDEQILLSLFSCLMAFVGYTVWLQFTGLHHWSQRMKSHILLMQC